MVVVASSLMPSCKQNAQETTRAFVSALNRSDKDKITQLSSEKFTYSFKGAEKKDLSEFLDKLDEIKERQINFSLLAIHGTDSVVTTEERITTMMDSLLQVKPTIEIHKTYRIQDGKINSITLDSTLYDEEHEKSTNEKVAALSYWAVETYSIQNGEGIDKNYSKYLTEYSKLSVSDKRKYETYATLMGTFISKGNPFYRKLIFKGKSTVVIVDALFGMSYPSSYELDEDYIRIRTDKSDLLLHIKDNRTLIGEGFIKGVFKKQGS
ncbi:hypothetical protein [Hymenobacter sp. UYCo722]|uniref:hypothetical protein n=1 Tax=Hymenobacter sp. UYCo722 TaxID=3156335 RepID=UPI003390798D